MCEPFADGIVPRSEDVAFFGVHPFSAEADDALSRVDDLGARLAAAPRAFVGEIGLDRLLTREVSPRMREVFERQLRLASQYHRPVALHGAKCWGQVVQTIERTVEPGAIPAYLFHGFSRSDGLLPQIVAMGGYISVGPSVLNDHAVNYRQLVKAIPLDRLLVETDRTSETAAKAPRIEEVVCSLAGCRGFTAEALAFRLERNADAFIACVCERRH